MNYKFTVWKRSKWNVWRRKCPECAVYNKQKCRQRKGLLAECYCKEDPYIVKLHTLTDCSVTCGPGFKSETEFHTKRFYYCERLKIFNFYNYCKHISNIIL